MASIQWVKLSDFPDVTLAHIMKSRLEAAGIQTMLGSENSARNLVHMQIAIGGAQLYVPDSDLAAAKSILDENLVADENNHEDEDVIAYITPHSRDKAARHSLIVALFAGFVPVLGWIAMIWIYVRTARGQGHLTKTGLWSLVFSAILTAASLIWQVSILNI